MWTMRKAKRGGDDTRSVRIRMTEQVSGRFVMDSTQDAWAGLSDFQQSYLSKSVASIALCKGDTILFSCSGIAMERQFSATRFLTSAALGEELNRRKEHHNELKVGAGNRHTVVTFAALGEELNRQKEHRNELKIEVRLEGNIVYMGCMDEYDLDRNFAVVSVPGFYLDVSVGPFQRALECLPLGEVFVCVGRDVSGKIMAKSVELNGEDDEDVACHKNNEAWQGGPVLFADHVVGMNLYLTTTRAIFKPWGTIYKHLEHCWMSQQMSKGFRFGARPMGEKSITYPHTVQGHYFKKDQHLDSDGYPKLPSTMLGSGMMLVNTFEETFGDKLDQHKKGVWSKLSKKASDIDRNVVTLASFKGEERFFACSGFFIEQNECATILTSASLLRSSSDENTIVENLRIEVLLRGKPREGTLLDYNLHCNVALVSVKGCRVLRPLNTVVARNYFEVAAVGRIFKTGELFATSGEMVGWTGTLDCIALKRSTCKSCKAAIGGPLVNLDGDVVGMNFYDMRIGTPYLPWGDILTILSWFRTKSKPGEDDYNPFGAPFDEVVGDEKAVLNRWPVPMPHWRHPDFVDGDNSDDEFVPQWKSGRSEVIYIAGVKNVLF